MRRTKKPKYKLDPKKIFLPEEKKNKKDKDWTPGELYEEQLRSKRRLGRR
ncbi:hypothetical protein ACFL1E_00600 [Candidatus Omnitrophota bacterium]